jgi:Bacterial PH domain
VHVGDGSGPSGRASTVRDTTPEWWTRSGDADPGHGGGWVDGHHQGMPEETAPADPATADTAVPIETATADTATPAGTSAPIGQSQVQTATTESDDATAETAIAGVPARPALPSRLVFRIPASALVAVVFMAMCSSWVAVASPWFALIYVLPVGVAVWLLRTRTVVDADKLVIRRMVTRTVLPWSAIAALRVADRKWVRAVRTDGGEVVLPTVRTRHLPVLALISGGRLPDPTDPGNDQLVPV